MCQNPSAIHLIEQFDDLSLFYSSLSKNPNIFEYDYEAMLESRTLLHDELLSVIYHPDNISHFKERL